MKIKTAEILRDVSEKTGVDAADIVGRCRKAHLCAARNLFFYECLRLSSQSASCIAQRYGFHHSTLMQGAAKHATLHDLEPVTGFNYAQLRRRMEGEVKARAKMLRAMTPDERQEFRDAENYRQRVNRKARPRREAINRNRRANFGGVGEGVEGDSTSPVRGEEGDSTRTPF